MSYTFSSLLPADFEDLVRDLIGREFSIRFEAFTAGPDAGMDGRHSVGKNHTILQAKHFTGSTYAGLKSKMKRERASIDKLALNRYILATSSPLTGPRKQELANIIGPALKTQSDIFSPADLNGLLRKFPDIERSHIKLWLTGVGVLSGVLRAAAGTFNNITEDEIKAKLLVFASNPSVDDARDKLEKSHVVIISGPPGVGKTTLAEMLTYAYIAEGWEHHGIRSLDDGFAAIDDAKKQVFLFDDFLGRVALDRDALSHTDSDLAKFLNRVRKSPNARFILTTRAPIFEEARRVSEHLADRRLDISKYLLDVGVYTRRIKARILYNHLLVSNTPKSFIAALIKSDCIQKIVDHQHYNPRIIEWMTDNARIGNLKPEEYPEAFLDGLAHPHSLWDIAFRTHISKACQHLLLALFFGSEYGVTLDDLKIDYEHLHRYLCGKYGTPYDPKDFEESLRILEGGFIAISNKQIQFINPSLRDYLTGYLNDLVVLQDFACAAHRSEWANNLWVHGKKLNPSPVDLENFSRCFLVAASQFKIEPTLRRVPHRTGGYAVHSFGLSNARRIEVLMSWWSESKETAFANAVLELSLNPVDGLDPWRDGDELVELICQLRDADYYEGFPFRNEVANALENGLLKILDDYISLDDLERISDAVENWKSRVGGDIISAIDEAIRTQVSNVKDIISDIDSDSTLNDHVKSLKRLTERISISSNEVDRAIDTIQERIFTLEERSSEASEPSFSTRKESSSDAFDDASLKNLFLPLLEDDQ